MIDKKELHEYVVNILDEKIVFIKKQIEELTASRDNETKSSMGDKYETGRSMIQTELDKQNTQLGLYFTQKKQLKQISLNQTHDYIQFGSLVETNSEKYFIAIGLGLLEFKKEQVYVISLASPIGMALKNHKKGDTITFQNRSLSIEKIN